MPHSWQACPQRWPLSSVSHALRVGLCLHTIAGTAATTFAKAKVRCRSCEAAAGAGGDV
jgi:hypothetical protein